MVGVAIVAGIAFSYLAVVLLALVLVLAWVAEAASNARRLA